MRQAARATQTIALTPLVPSLIPGPAACVPQQQPTVSGSRRLRQHDGRTRVAVTAGARPPRRATCPRQASPTRANAEARGSLCQPAAAQRDAGTAQRRAAWELRRDPAPQRRAPRQHGSSRDSRRPPMGPPGGDVSLVARPRPTCQAHVGRGGRHGPRTAASTARLAFPTVDLRRTTGPHQPSRLVCL